MFRTKTIAVLLLLLTACSRQPGSDTPRSSRTSRAAAPRASAQAPQAQPASELPPCPDKPNILLISLDTLRFDATSLGANGKNRTPFLEQLAGVGLNFVRAYSTHDSTPYSHFSMLTGYINGYQSPIDVPEVSLAHQLKQRGYRTWGVSANGNLSPKFTRSMQPFGSFVNLHEQWQEMPADRKAAMLPRLDAQLAAYDHALTEWNRMMLFSMGGAVLRHIEPRLDGKQPFFGMINLLHAHDPYLPTPSSYDRHREKKGVTVPDLRNRPVLPELADPATIADETRRAEIVETLARSNVGALATTFDLSPDQLAIYRRRYHARVRELDAAVGEIVRELRERKLLDSTILVVTSDHGEAFGERNLITHSFGNRGDLEATNRVPLVIVFPPCYRVTPRAVDTLCTIADIPPTLYDLLGIDAHPIWKRTVPGNVGRSLLPYTGDRTIARTSLTVAVTTPAQPSSAAERRKQDEEALKRFKALGYLR
ncbi:MAG TPA: sulfatase-like hydrolase/transferase [Thermoanaerobaculia bacterium]|nr:sulfatase-like hydrolase/transferase [Thermoanaerobaculia bacterium]